MSPKSNGLRPYKKRRGHREKRNMKMEPEIGSQGTPRIAGNHQKLGELHVWIQKESTLPIP